MNKTIQKIAIIGLLFISVSCSKDEVLLQEDIQQIKPMDIELLESSINDNDGIEQGRLLATETSTFWSPSDNPNDPNSSYFYLEGDQVIEKKGGETVVTFSVYFQGIDFLYIYDDSRDLSMALPTWKPNDKASVWFLHDDFGEWVEWKSYIYEVDPCENDTEAPIFNRECEYRTGLFGGWSCEVVLVYAEFPTYVKSEASNLATLKLLFDLTDNCDNGLTVIEQTPAPGTAITKAGVNYIDYKISDSSGNILEVTMLYDYRQYQPGVPF